MLFFYYQDLTTNPYPEGTNTMWRPNVHCGEHIQLHQLDVSDKAIANRPPIHPATLIARGARESMSDFLCPWCSVGMMGGLCQGQHLNVNFAFEIIDKNSRPSMIRSAISVPPYHSG